MLSLLVARVSWIDLTLVLGIAMASTDHTGAHRVSLVVCQRPLNALSYGTIGVLQVCANSSSH